MIERLLAFSFDKDNYCFDSIGFDDGSSGLYDFYDCNDGKLQLNFFQYNLILVAILATEDFIYVIGGRIESYEDKVSKLSINIIYLLFKKSIFNYHLCIILW